MFLGNLKLEKTPLNWMPRKNEIVTNLVLEFREARRQFQTGFVENTIGLSFSNPIGNKPRSLQPTINPCPTSSPPTTQCTAPFHQYCTQRFNTSVQIAPK